MIYFIANLALAVYLLCLGKCHTLGVTLIPSAWKPQSAERNENIGNLFMFELEKHILGLL